MTFLRFLSCLTRFLEHWSFPYLTKPLKNSLIVGIVDIVIR